MKKKTNVTITQYVTDFASKAERIAEAETEILDKLLSITLLSTLPTEYENFIVVMESRDEFSLLESSKWKLIEEEAKQCDRSAKSDIDNNVLLSKNRKFRSKTNRSKRQS